jgi:protein-S-isoprenylcysteine O-methyltransferase Ste14
MEGRSYYAFAVLQTLVVCGLLWFIFTRPTGWDLQRGIGTALLFIGILGIAIARYQLGRSFAVRAEAHQLVTRGIYSKIRNPIYVFGTVMIAGFVHSQACRMAVRSGSRHLADRTRSSRGARSRSCIRRRLPRIPPQNLVVTIMV